MTRFAILCIVTVIPPLMTVGAAAQSEHPPLEEVYSGTAKAVKKQAAAKEAAAKAAAAEGQPKEAVRPVKVSELLRELPAEDRALVMERLRLVDGRVASVYTAPLTKAFKTEKVDEILSALGGSVGAAPRASGKPRLADMSKLLAALSTDVKRDFYDSMVFYDGELVSFRIDGLRANASKAKLDEILLALGFDPANEAKLDSKGLCGGQGGDTWCNDSICDFPETGPLKCISEKDYTCKSASCRARP